MKQITLLTILGLFYINSSAQELNLTPNRNLKMQNQFGFNATDFIKSFFSFNSNTPTATANVPVYNLNYKALFSNVILPSNYKFGLRLGLSLASNENKNGTDTTYTNTKNNSLSWRAGIEVQQMLSNRLLIYYGIDFFISNSTDKRDTRSVYNASPPVTPNVFYILNSKTIVNRSGAGPLIGVQFNINKYFSISTEAAFYFVKGTNSVTNDYTMSNGSVYNGYKQASTKGSTKQTAISLPAFINLNFMF
ncbi:MAG: hypothetical protein Q8M15_13450 [Bacteroidota bacterium]|nr:hypothetical protein [Bacteroidota bacterium]